MKKTWMLAFILLVVMVFSACSMNKLAEKVAGDILSQGNSSSENEEESDDDVDVQISTSAGSVVAGDNLAWPKDAMGNLPAIEGNITAVISSDTYGAVTCDNMSKSQAENYLAKIEALGYDGVSGSDNTAMYFYGADSKGAAVAFNYEFESGEGFITYTAPPSD